MDAKEVTITIITTVSTITDSLTEDKFGFSILNEKQCPYHLFLKGCSVDPIFVFTQLSEVTVGIFLTFSVLHLPGNGHLCLFFFKHLQSSTIKSFLNNFLL